MLSYQYLLGYITNLNNISSATKSNLLFLAIVRNSTEKRVYKHRLILITSIYINNVAAFFTGTCVVWVNSDLEFPPCRG